MAKRLGSPSSCRRGAALCYAAEEEPMVAAPWRSHLLLCAGGARASAVAQASLLSPRRRSVSWRLPRGWLCAAAAEQWLAGSAGGAVCLMPSSSWSPFGAAEQLLVVPCWWGPWWCSIGGAPDGLAAEEPFCLSALEESLVAQPWRSLSLCRPAGAASRAAC